jgi:hypothetical protein
MKSDLLFRNFNFLKKNMNLKSLGKKRYRFHHCKMSGIGE